MNSYRRGLRNGVLVNPKLFILEKVNFGPHAKCWSNLIKSGQAQSNLVKRVTNLYYLVRVITILESSLCISALSLLSISFFHSSSLCLSICSHCCSLFLKSASRNSSLIFCCYSHLLSLSSISFFIDTNISIISAFP